MSNQSTTGDDQLADGDRLADSDAPTDTDHLADIGDSAGCTEIWETLSEHRATEGDSETASSHATAEK